MEGGSHVGSALVLPAAKGEPDVNENGESCGCPRGCGAGDGAAAEGDAERHIDGQEACTHQPVLPLILPNLGVHVIHMLKDVTM
jgi:hypothetical protein